LVDKLMGGVDASNLDSYCLLLLRGEYAINLDPILFLDSLFSVLEELDVLPLEAENTNREEAFVYSSLRV